METIGRLTGGIAHDFNNLLGIILGQIELAWEKSEDELVSNRLRVAIDAAERGARLTNKLLAFARKQTLEPTSLQIPTLISEMSDLLRQAVGKSIKIDVRQSEAPCWPVMADATQVENAILNLALNAKDAMPEGGQLKISMRNIAKEQAAAIADIALDPGDYLLIEVTDTGTGMSEELQTKAAEPFFTTKPFGVGSGLGLSMVDGFVNQSGGRLQIVSREGEGTSIGLYLPRSNEAAGEAKVWKGSAIGHSPNGEPVLVVEENDEVRHMLVAILDSLGYRVHQALNATSALELLKTMVPIELLIADSQITDQKDGRNLLHWTRNNLPELAIIFTIGANGQKELASQQPNKDTAYLMKPIEEDALTDLLSTAFPR